MNVMAKMMMIVPDLSLRKMKAMKAKITKAGEIEYADDAKDGN